MDFDAKFRERFSPHPSLILPENHHSKQPRDDQFSLSLEGTLLSNFDLNVDLHGSSFYQPNGLDSYDNFDFYFYETKPFENHVALDSLNQSEGHSQIINPINLLSSSPQTYNPFCFYDLGPMKFRPSDERSSTTPLTKATSVPNRLSTTTVLRKGGRDHRKKKSTVVKGQWTIEEDRHLIQLVERYGIRKWSQIAQMLNGRVGKQCRERWHNHLKPDIKKDVWSEEEDRILIKAHEEIGNKWAEIAKLLPGRTENSIKNHWNATKRRQFSKRKCKSKYPRQSSLLQEYIKGLTLEKINAGCRKKPLSYTNNGAGAGAGAGAAATKSPSDHPSISSSSDQLMQAAEYEYFSEVPDFNFDAQIFEESSIDSLLDYAPPENNSGEDYQGLNEVVNEAQGHLGSFMLHHEVKMEFDLVEMINHVNL